MTDRKTETPVSVARVDRVAVITIDHPPVNAISHAVRVGLIEAFQQVASDPAVDGIVLTGAGRTFVAGADVREMDLPAGEPSLPTVIATMESCDQPIVAAIGGTALGGGLELALACDLRLAAPSASVGLPETRLGIVPGAGGTQRLPRLVGIAQAITLIGTAKVVKAGEALQIGILDEIVDGDLIAHAIAAAPRAPKRRLSQASVPRSDSTEVETAMTNVTRRAKGVPAIGEAARLVADTAQRSFAEGLADERACFLRLRESLEARALRHLFFAEREAAKVPGLEQKAPRPVATVSVIGGGTMGSGIAVAVASAGLDVTVIERDSAATAGDRIRGIYERLVRSGRLSESAAASCLARVTATADWQGIQRSDLIIEAVFEDMALKQDVFRRLDGMARDGAILATNTSYLDVDAIAAVTRRPHDVIGLHFFAPANVMRLMEVVQAAKTAPDAVATALAFAKRIGKLAVVAGVCDGFIGNRIFAQYRKHCEYLVEDGAMPEEVDAAVEAMGFAMGPFAVSDLSGLDIGWAMRKRRAATRDPRERYVAIADHICETGRLGQKTGCGWYAYPDGAARGVSDPAVAAIIAAERAAKGVRPQTFSAGDIQRRIWAVMANEAAKILAEGIALRPSDIDLVLVNGYGLAPRTGGPMFAADAAGLAGVLEEVERAAVVGGAGSEPSALLIDLVRTGRTFRDLGR